MVRVPRFNRLQFLPANLLDDTSLLSQEVSGVGPQAEAIKVSSEGDGETGSKILAISDRLVSAMVSPGRNESTTTVNSSTVGTKILAFTAFYCTLFDGENIFQTFLCAVALTLETIGPGSGDQSGSHLFVNGNSMDINLESLAKNNNGEIGANPILNTVRAF